MKIKSVDKVTQIQFEIENLDGRTYLYRRDWNYDDWEILLGQSWETLYDCDELEEMYQTYITTDDYIRIT